MQRIQLDKLRVNRQLREAEWVVLTFMTNESRSPFQSCSILKKLEQEEGIPFINT